MPALLAAVVLLADQDAEALKARLAKIGEHSYRFAIEGRQVGTLTMKTSVLKTDDRELAIFEDALFMEDPSGKRIDIFTKQTSALDALLKPVVIDSKSTVEAWTFSATFKKDGAKTMLRLIAGGVEKHEEVSDRATTMTSVWRAVCVAEQKRDAVIEFDWLKGQKLAAIPGNKATCRGEERIAIDGKDYESTKWLHTFEGGETSLWVAKEGYLLRVTGGPQVMELAEKK